MGDDGLVGLSPSLLEDPQDLEGRVGVAPRVEADGAPERLLDRRAGTDRLLLKIWRGRRGEKWPLSEFYGTYCVLLLAQCMQHPDGTLKLTSVYKLTKKIVTFMWYPNDMLRYMFKDEFATLVSLKVPSGFRLLPCSGHVHPISPTSPA